MGDQEVLAVLSRENLRTRNSVGVEESVPGRGRSPLVAAGSR